MRQFAAWFAVGVVAVACGSSKTGFEGGSKPNTETVGPTLPGETGFAAPDPAANSECAKAAAAKSYVGCDYWPTVNANWVLDVFDFTVAIANVGEKPAEVEISGPGVQQNVTVEPGQLQKVLLPWVPALKGPDSRQRNAMTSSVIARKGAYHLTSDVPVVVYQFNPLQYRGGTGGKWSSCLVIPPADARYSYSNDASLLLPSTAMTGNYRVMGYNGWTARGGLLGGDVGVPPHVAITAVQDNTKVTVKLGPKAKLVSGNGVPAGNPGGTVTIDLDAGDVAELISGGGANFDFSGSLITSDKPVQVISGIACTNIPADVAACDHLEETVFPAETLGKHYVVTVPTSPKGNVIGHVVRLYGNQDGTKLTYKPAKPAGCPAELAAGQVADCGVVSQDFEIESEAEFGVGSFQLGGERVGARANLPDGDPSQSFAVAIEQYRTRYLFLAPRDYTTSYIDLVAEAGTEVTLDGQNVSSSLKPLGGTAYAVARITLGAGRDGVHDLSASKPVGIQVIGYGANTSYQYPGGLNLEAIAPPPVK